MRTLVSNKSAYHDYQIVDKVEAGIVLEGWEVKSLKSAHGSIVGAFIYADNQSQLWIRGMHIPEWKHGEAKGEQQKNRVRKLLLRKSQQIKLASMAKQPGFSLIPLEIVETGRNLVKVNIALVKGKRQHERKQDIKEREVKRQLARAKLRY
jgi:SsrA-binding protein